MTERLKLTYPSLPPSLNEIYKVNRKTGALYLDSKAKAFKEEFKKFAKDNWIKEIHEFDVIGIYRVTYKFFFPYQDIINDKFGIDKRIKSRYKRVDADNRQKLLQDSLSTAFGFNDSQIFESSCSKIASKDPRVEIFIFPTVEEHYLEWSV